MKQTQNNRTRSARGTNMKRIQIIEDDEAIRTELKTLLRANGYQPVD